METEKNEEIRSRLDKSIIITMLTALIISIFVLGLTYQNHHFTEKIRIIIPETGNSVGDSVLLTCNFSKNYKCEWSFDGIISNDTGRTVKHIFTQSGKHLIGVIVNKQYEKFEFINIEKTHNASVLNSQLFKPVVQAPFECEKGKSVHFSDMNPLDTSWEWYFEINSITPDSRLRNPVYIYNSPGPNTVRLSVNHHTQIDTSFSINVKSANIVVKVQEAPKTCSPIDVQQMVTDLQQISKGNMQISDIEPFFSKKATEVMVEFKVKGGLLNLREKGTKQISLAQACEQLKKGSYSKISIENFTKNENLYITTMKIIAKY
jgi:hypothetical protein